MLDCPFCRIVTRELPAKEVYRDDTLVAFHDISPKAPTHILIIPTEHVASVAELEDAHADLVGRVVLKARDLAREQGIEETGYRLVFNTRAHSGQEVDHLHLHLLGGAQLGPMA